MFFGLRIRTFRLIQRTTVAKDKNPQSKLQDVSARTRTYKINKRFRGLWRELRVHRRSIDPYILLASEEEDPITNSRPGHFSLTCWLTSCLCLAVNIQSAHNQADKKEEERHHAETLRICFWYRERKSQMLPSFNILAKKKGNSQKFDLSFHARASFQDVFFFLEGKLGSFVSVCVRVK